MTVSLYNAYKGSPAGDCPCLRGVPHTIAKKWSVLNKIVVLERARFEASQDMVFGRLAGW